MYNGLKSSERRLNIEFLEGEIIEYSKAIIVLGTFLPDIEGVDPPVNEYAKLLSLHKKLNTIEVI